MSDCGGKCDGCHKGAGGTHKKGGKNCGSEQCDGTSKKDGSCDCSCCDEDKGI